MLDTITRKTAKNVKKCKGDIIKELQHVETEYRKRFRDMESRNQQLERKNEALENENKRLRVVCTEMEKMRMNIEPIPVMRHSMSSTCAPSPRNQLMPLFAECSGHEPMLDASSSASDTSSPLGADLYDHMREKIVDEDILESLIHTEAAWACNEFMV